MPFGSTKARRQPSENSISNQCFIAAVLFRRSQELWRISGGERRNSASPPFRQSGGLREETRKYWVFLPLKFGRERFARGPNGGGKGSGIQRSLLVSPCYCWGTICVQFESRPWKQLSPTIRASSWRLSITITLTTAYEARLPQPCPDWR